jgi:hypothetical protein
VDQLFDILLAERALDACSKPGIHTLAVEAMQARKETYLLVSRELTQAYAALAIIFIPSSAFRVSELDLR